MGEATILNKGNGCGEWTAGRKSLIALAVPRHD